MFIKNFTHSGGGTFADVELTRDEIASAGAASYPLYLALYVDDANGLYDYETLVKIKGLTNHLPPKVSSSASPSVVGGIVLSTGGAVIQGIKLTSRSTTTATSITIKLMEVQDEYS